jgi:FkbM family methyltransferase
MPEAFAQLTRNIRDHTQTTNAQALRYAAFSTDTTLEFHDFGLTDAGLNSAFGARREKRPSNSVRKVTVEARTCDRIASDLGLDSVDVVKIDAESSEMHVLQGMERLIACRPPKIIMEVGDYDLPGVASSAELVRRLVAHGYSAYEQLGGDLVPHVALTRYKYANLLFSRERLGNV